MAEEKIIPMHQPEKLVLLKKCRVKEHGEGLAKPRKAGDVVTVSGMDKQELIANNLASRDVPKKGDK